jgi:hypothetical protein
MCDDKYINKCVAIKKTKGDINDPNYKFDLRCKSNKQHNSIFCGVHKKHKPDLVAVMLQIINDNKDWITLPINKKTKESDIAIQIQNHKDEIEKSILDKIIEENDKLNSITNCKVCCDSVTNNSELIRCSKVTSSNEHLVCKTCVLGHIDSLITDSIGSYSCMFNKSDKCGGEYSISDINTVINNPEKQEKWDELINISEIHKMASICDDYVICPLCCKWGCIFETPAGFQGNVYIPCEKCGERWCNLCKRKSHSHISCYKLEFNEEETIDKRIEIIDRMIQELVTKALTHCCSTCGCSYIKEEGCNLMMCPKCESMSCYLCTMKLYYKNNTKYWHFVGHELSDPDAQCALWNNIAGDGKTNQGNTEFNESAVKRSLINFITENRDNVEISILICKRILTIFEKDKEYTKLIEIINKFNEDFLKIF